MNTPTEQQKKDLRRIKYAIWAVMTVCVVLGVYVYIQDMPPPAHLYDDLAKCITQSGTKFYGAYWCPHCADQKTKFGTGAQYLPYVECSLPDASGRTQVCIDEKIENYPTWVFPDGSRKVGVQTPQQLAEKTGCQL